MLKKNFNLLDFPEKILTPDLLQATFLNNAMQKPLKLEGVLPLVLIANGNFYSYSFENINNVTGKKTLNAICELTRKDSKTLCTVINFTQNSDSEDLVVNKVRACVLGKNDAQSFPATIEEMYIATIITQFLYNKDYELQEYIKSSFEDILNKSLDFEDTATKDNIKTTYHNTVNYITSLCPDLCNKIDERIFESIPISIQEIKSGVLSFPAIDSFGNNKPQFLLPSSNETKMSLPKKENFVISSPDDYSEKEKTEMKLLEQTLENSYVADEKIIMLANLISKQKKRCPDKPINCLLTGPAGTGKTTGAQALAMFLGIPYTKITCGVDTTEETFLGAIMPNEQNDEFDDDTDATSYLKNSDFLAKVVFNPAEAYEELTGEKNANITTTEIIEYLVAKQNSKQKTQNNSSGFKYVGSEFVKAFEKGYLVEIQEPTVIKSPGTLVKLNGALDDCQKIELPNGKIIHRHPNCIVVMTTNIDYDGCFGMNQSVLSRQTFKCNLTLPTKKQILKRVKSHLQNNQILDVISDKQIMSMIEVTEKINNYLSENAIDDGVVGFRELLSWVETTIDLQGDAKLAATFTIIPSATNDVSVYGILEEIIMKTLYF